MLIIFSRLLSYLLLVFVITFVAIPTISQAAASELLPEASIPATLAIPEKTPPRPTSTELPNPFSNIESWSYPNGLQVFFKSMPKSDIVTYRMTLPTGARQDPPGREGLAHFVEHMLFTGANGRKKAEFEKLIDERGGSNNASTNAYQTDYWLELPAQEWQFGFQWFEELLFDHRFDSELVEEERRAVILERDLQAKTPINYFQDWILQPNWSKSPHEWDTVFGLPSDYRKVIGTWKTVSSINTSDIQSFYDQYYGPQNMTITLIGAFDRERVKTLFDQRFGRKAAFGENTKRLHQTHSNHRYKKIYEFQKRGGHAHTITQYIPNINKNDFMWLLFLRDLLHENLNRELRQKKQAAYGVSVEFNTDQGQAKLHISGNFDPPQEAQSLQFIHTFLAQLTSKDVDPETFEILRRRIIAERKINYQNPWDISNWVKTVFYNREIFSGEYPDIIEFYKQADAQDLSLWMINRIDKNLRVDKTYRPSTMWSLVETCLLILSALLTFSFARSYLIKPLDLRKSLYTRKILYGPIASTIVFFVLFTFSIFGLHLLDLSLKGVYNNIISRIDSYTIYILWSNFVIAVITVFLIFIPTRIPRKVMLQKDNWRVKHLSYHSRIMNYDDIISVSEKYCLTVLINWRGWPCRLLHFNPLSKGVYIQLKRGSYFLKSRDNTALIEKFKTHMKSASDDDISADVITHEHAENLNPNASHSQVR